MHDISLRINRVDPDGARPTPFAVRPVDNTAVLTDALTDLDQIVDGNDQFDG